MTGRYDYEESKRLIKGNPPFYSLIKAAMWRADTQNLAMLKQCWPQEWEDLQARYNAPGAVLPTDPDYDAFMKQGS